MTAVAPKPFCVTAADQLYSRSVAQLLLSAERHRADRDYRWITYDLGFDPDRRRWLEARFSWCDFRRVPFEDLPPHYLPSRRSYAWKPWAVWQVVRDADALVLSIDSAAVIKGDLFEIFDWTREHGIYMARGRETMRHRCEPSVMRALDYPADLVDTRERVANLVCFDPSNPVAYGIVRDWERLSRTPDLLLPVEKTVEIHMSDQALLNCLVLPQAAAGAIRLPDEDMDISAGRPIRMLSTRNKLPPWLPLWADPLARLWYWMYKTVDQALWRRKDRNTP